MAYLGVDPNVGDITFQKFTGTGSATSFTLSQNVASGEAILVTVGNVLQEPGVTASYIAQGTTLTFSEAPANGDDIVVRFLGRAVDQPLSFAMQLFKYVATANQTAFTGADSAGAILAFGSDVDVYLNGVHLDTTDFTLSGGDTVTLASGATVNDELVIRAFRAFAATDTVSKASGGTFSGGVSMGSTLSVTGTSTFTGAITSSGGIKLGGTASTNLLNNYVNDGTWSPYFSNITGDAIFNETPAIQAGTYQRVGDYVYLNAYLKNAASVTTTSSYSASSGTYIGGLPFAVPSGNTNFHAGSVGYQVQLVGGYDSTNLSVPITLITEASRSVLRMSYPLGVTTSQVLNSYVGNNTGLIFSINYKVT